MLNDLENDEVNLKASRPKPDHANLVTYESARTLPENEVPEQLIVFDAGISRRLVTEANACVKPAAKIIGTKLRFLVTIHMLIIRPTASLAKRMKTSLPLNTSSSTTRLGDWYLLDITLNKKQLVLCMSSLARLAVIMNAAPYASIPERLPDAIAELLAKLDIPPPLIHNELREMSQILIAKTMDRSILGTMNENRFQLEYMANSERVDLNDPLSMSLALSNLISLKLPELYPAHTALRLFDLDHTEALRNMIEAKKRHLRLV
jgi:hypothetical protein